MVQSLPELYRIERNTIGTEDIAELGVSNYPLLEIVQPDLRHHVPRTKTCCGCVPGLEAHHPRRRHTHGLSAATMTTLYSTHRKLVPSAASLIISREFINEGRIYK